MSYDTPEELARKALTVANGSYRGARELVNKNWDKVHRADALRLLDKWEREGH